ncbi:hypothetical protein J2S78_002696 [Salibacterium salarium]|nr:hypothetical protein [Salibacterium salarium]
MNINENEYGFRPIHAGAVIGAARTKEQEGLLLFYVSLLSFMKM